MTMTRFFIAHLLAPSLLLGSCFAAETAADRVYRNGRVFTADSQDSKPRQLPSETVALCM